MKVNEEADGVTALQRRVHDLEECLREFVSPMRGYSSGIDGHGQRWCAPRVTAEQMDRARELTALPAAEAA